MTTVTYSISLNSCVYQMFTSFSRRLILRRSLARLEQLDDRLLKDIGLSRDGLANSNRFTQQIPMQIGNQNHDRAA